MSVAMASGMSKRTTARSWRNNNTGSMNHDGDSEYMKSEGGFFERNSNVPDNRGQIKWGKSAAMTTMSSFASCCRVHSQIDCGFDGLNHSRQ